jgi:ligand-binding sensor domain-containing protein/signal transduction histidine kinase
LSLINSNSSPETGVNLRGFFRGAAAGLALVLLSGRAHGLDPHRSISQYSRSRWGVESGFPGGSVSAIAQTSDGYLWIGTGKGLIRFDGLDFRVYQQAVPNAFPIGPVQGLAADSSGDLWILLKSTRILRYHQGNFELGRDEAELGVTTLGRLRSGAVLLSSMVFGPLTFAGERFKTLASSPGAAPGSKPNAQPDTIDDLSTHLSWSTSVAAHRFAQPDSAVIAIAESSDGTLWLATRDKGLFCMKDGRVRAVNLGRPVTGITSLLPFDSGKLWIGTAGGVLEWNGTVLTQDGVPVPLRHVADLAMIRDRDSNVWVVTPAGLLRIHGDEVVKDELRTAAADRVTALFEDREGNLWLGSPLGIERLRDTAFVTYTADGLDSGSSGAVYPAPDGRTWFSPVDGGLHWIEDGKSGTLASDGLDRDVVYSIAGDGNDLWLGRQRGGLTHLRFSGASVSSKTYTHAAGLAQDSVFTVYRSRDGTVWAGTLSGGVSELKDEHFTTYSTAQGLASDAVTAIAEGRDGTMWFGTPMGLNSLSVAQGRLLTVREGMPSDNVNCLLAGSAGVLWIGTASGLAFLRSGHVEVPAGDLPSLRGQILGIAEDRGGRLWIATANHVLAVDRDKLLGPGPSAADLREFGIEDGLLGTEGVKRQNSVAADTSGQVWFSMNRGLSVVNPVRAAATSSAAIVQIERLSADGAVQDLRQPVRIPAGIRRFAFAYSGLSLSVPERVRFKWKLDGFDQRWSDPVSVREAVYTNLSPGSYRFHVLASNSDGAWNSEAATLDLTVVPAWYQTLWFRLLLVISIVAAVSAVYRIRVGQIAAAMSVRFDERLAERTRLARDLHDTFLQTIQASKMVADDALEDPADSDKIRHTMERLAAWLDRAAHDARAALTSLRASVTEQNDLADGLRMAIDECRNLTPMEISFTVYGVARELHPILRDEIFRISYEAIQNATCRPGGTRMDVRLTYARSLSVSVHDNGAPAGRGSSENGEGVGEFQRMKGRATRIGARLKIESKPGFGTRITLVVPGRIVFRTAARLDG